MNVCCPVCLSTALPLDTRCDASSESRRLSSFVPAVSRGLLRAASGSPCAVGSSSIARLCLFRRDELADLLRSHRQSHSGYLCFRDLPRSQGVKLLLGRRVRLGCLVRLYRG